MSIKLLTYTEAGIIYDALVDAYEVCENSGEEAVSVEISNALEILEKLKQVDADEVIH